MIVVDEFDSICLDRELLFTGDAKSKRDCRIVGLTATSEDTLMASETNYLTGKLGFKFL